MKARYLVDGTRDADLQLAWAWLIQESERAGAGALAVLLLDHVRTLGTRGIMHAGAARTLERDRSIGIQNSNARIHLIAERARDNPRFDRPVPILAVWPTDDFIAKIDRLNDGPLCVAWWLEKDIATWTAAHGPANLATGVQHETSSISDPIVRVALENVDQGVNRGTGISHPMDKSLAVNTFKLLRDRGHAFTAAEVQVFAMQHNWDPRGAAALAEVAQAILDRRAIRTHSKWAGQQRKDVYAHWKERAAGDTTDQSYGP